ncbi:uncharacterized protein [Halyomorpha halys]|uniref:uncharacterized protein n=1 Tax=Halyomorpha halys TaxID=286706 RepID=UPI0034D212ED
MWIFTLSTLAGAITKYEQELLVFERKILRRLYGGVLIGGKWKRENNQDLYIMFKEHDIVRVIKIARLRWVGHVVRMDNEDPPRQLLMEPLHGTRRRGRPKLRWADGVAVDATNMLGLQDWVAAARDQDNWRKLLDEARIRHRIVEPH